MGGFRIDIMDSSLGTSPLEEIIETIENNDIERNILKIK
jgi:hypothetical protein